MFQIVHQLIGSFRLARIIMQMLLVASYCLRTSAPSFPFPCLFLSWRTGAVISFSTRRHRVGGRYLRFRRACGKLGSPRRGSAVSHSRSRSYIIPCGEVRVRCQRAGAISLCPGGGGASHCADLFHLRFSPPDDGVTDVLHV